MDKQGFAAQEGCGGGQKTAGVNDTNCELGCTTQTKAPKENRVVGVKILPTLAIQALQLRLEREEACIQA